MAFNKAKTVESAIKYLNQGKISEAIRDYQQVLRFDPKDQVTLMTVGDLFARQGDMPHAIEYFERLAQVYLSEGFNSKAIAIYKKIAKLAPNELQPLERLADLYVQQGVLSEARPLFLQIAEAHLKANHSQKAVEVLRRLVEIEPDNLRVQMRLAELYNTMGQKKEAAQNYLNSARRLSERGDAADAQKLIDKALEADPQNKSAALLKAQVAATGGHPEQAVELLRRLPESQEGGETTDLLVDSLVKAGKADEAGKLVRTIFAAHHEAHQLPTRLARMMLDAGQADQAYNLLVDCRDGLIDAGEQENFREALTLAIERLPNRIEPLETLVDFYGRTSDSFRLPEGILQLAQAQQAAGNYAEAEKLISELVEKNPDNEKFLARLNELRTQRGLPAQAAEPLPAMTDIVDAPSPSVAAEPAPPPPAEAALSEETEKYISQALTDVDLFSSYGLTQKAMNLLDNILERAPRHVPTLERLLDLCLASGNDRRTAQLAARLEQIHNERGDTTEAERLAELRARYERAADLKGASAAPPPTAATPPVGAAASPAPTTPPTATPVSQSTTAFNMPEFSVPVTIPEPPEEAPEEVGVPAQARAESPIPVVDRELDLSDEWEALAQEFGEAQQSVAAPPTAPESVPAASGPAEMPVPEMAVPTAPAEESPSEELFLDVSELSFESDAAAASSGAVSPADTSAPPEFSIPLETEPAEAQEEAPEPLQTQASIASRESVLSEVEIPHESRGTSFTLIDEDEGDHVEAEAPAEAIPAGAGMPAEEGAESQSAELEMPPEAPVPVAAEPVHAAQSVHSADEQQEPSDLEFELVPSDTESANAASTMMPDDFFSELAAEVEALDLGSAVPPAASSSGQPVQPVAAAETNGAKPREKAPVPSSVPQPAAVISAAPSNGNLSGLDEVFEEFRSELGEMNDQDEDLETHYNLGIAYREMGLLDEAIGEFQKVAKAVQGGKAFRYAMQCSTLLGLTFLDKGDPKIAAMWYMRALDVPGIDQETILALRYDLGIAQDLAGDSSAALESFRQVYAMNIDYRDVADRIATLRKR